MHARWICIVFLLFSEVVGAEGWLEQTSVTGSFNLPVFAPAGQSFLGVGKPLEWVTLKLADAGGEGVGNWLIVQVRHLEVGDSPFTGELLATSEQKFLPDCFNWSQGPGCGRVGGFGVPVTLYFYPSVPLLDRRRYFIEIVVEPDGDGLLLGFGDGNGYTNGDMWRGDKFEDHDLFMMLGGVSLSTLTF